MNVLLIGDSHSQVYFRFLLPLIESEGHTVISQISKPGWATYSFNEQPQTLSSGANADVVLVSLGGNNSLLNDAQYGNAVTTFLSNIGYPNKRVVWVGPAISLQPSVENRHQWTADWLKQNLPKDITFIDARDFTATGHGSDGVHFTTEGYERWANEIAPKALRAMRLSPILYKAKTHLPSILLITAMLGLVYAGWRRYGNK